MIPRQIVVNVTSPHNNEFLQEIEMSRYQRTRAHIQGKIPWKRADCYDERRWLC